MTFRDFAQGAFRLRGIGKRPNHLPFRYSGVAPYILLAFCLSEDLCAYALRLRLLIHDLFIACDSHPRSVTSYGAGIAAERK